MELLIFLIRIVYNIIINFINKIKILNKTCLIYFHRIHTIILMFIIKFLIK